MSDIVLDIEEDATGSFFSLSGDIDHLKGNRRLLVSLKRLNYSIAEGRILVPYSEKNQILVLQDLQRLFEKFSLTLQQSTKISSELDSYTRESQGFDEFSRLAFAIRNDDFKKHPSLVDEFGDFQNFLEARVVRRLYPLQRLSAFHLAFSQNACNFAVPGAGKTSIVYAAYAYLKNLPEDNDRHVDTLLVIGPLSSFAPWENEYEKCFGRVGTFQRMSGDLSISKHKKLQHLYSGRPAEVTLIAHAGVETYQKDLLEFLKRNRTMVVVDEAHRIKNPDGIWGKAVTEISKEARARVILTGTPIPNGYQDIFNLYKFIYPYKYKDIIGFHYQNLQEMTAKVELESPRIQQLKNNLAPYFLRIKKEDLKLPPTEEKIVYVDMNPLQKELYGLIESTYVKSFKNNPSATVKDMVNKAKLIRLRQAASNPALLALPLSGALEVNDSTGETDPNSQFVNNDDLAIHDADFFKKILKYYDFETPSKFQKVLELIETQLSAYDKVIVWTIFVQNAVNLQEYLKKQGVPSRLLIGQVEQFDREQTIDLFNDPDNLDFRVVIANPFAVGESISLHRGCHNAIYFERDYNCANFLQSKDRIHRVGLEDDQITCYYYVLAKGTIDEIIYGRLEQKIAQMNHIINDDIPLFARINESDETDLVEALLKQYDQRA